MNSRLTKLIYILLALSKVEGLALSLLVPFIFRCVIAVN